MQPWHAQPAVALGPGTRAWPSHRGVPGGPGHRRGQRSSAFHRLLGKLLHPRGPLRRQLTNDVGYEAPDVSLHEGGLFCARGVSLGWRCLLPPSFRGIVMLVHCEVARHVAVGAAGNAGNVAGNCPGWGATMPRAA